MTSTTTLKKTRLKKSRTRKKVGRPKLYHSFLDDEIYLALYYAHGHMLTIYQLMSLTGRSRSSLARRIATLLEPKHKWLVSPYAQLLRPKSSGQPLRHLYDDTWPKQPLYQEPWLDEQYQPDLIALSNKAAHYVSKKYKLKIKAIPNRFRDGQNKRRFNQNAYRASSPEHYQHHLEDNDALIILAKEISAMTNTSFIPQSEITRYNPISLETLIYKMGNHKTSNAIPDGFFAIEERDENPVYYFLEYDRGTRIHSASIEYRSIMRKFLTYDRVADFGAHKKALSIANFNVLFITTTPDRVTRMIKEVKYCHDKLGVKRPDRFLFTDVETIFDHGSISDPIWRDVYNNIPFALPTTPPPPSLYF